MAFGKGRIIIISRFPLRATMTPKMKFVGPGNSGFVGYGDLFYRRYL